MSLYSGEHGGGKGLLPRLISVAPSGIRRYDAKYAPYCHGCVESYRKELLSFGIQPQLYIEAF